MLSSSSVFSKHDPAVDLDGDFYSVYQASIKLHIHVTVIVNTIPFEGQLSGLFQGPDKGLDPGC